MRKKLSFKNHKGYTLIEMLVAVAIIIIISMIAIPAVGSLRKSLTLTKYDDMARQIYLISQNKLTTMKASGTLSVFLGKVEEKYGSQKLKAEPQDYTDIKNDWSQLYYLTDADDVYVDYIMGEKSILTASMENDGHFLVELNPKTGDVYGVFYAEKAFTYDEIKELASREKKERKGKMLGYYGGISEFSSGEEMPKEFTPTAQIVNKEDLYLKITSTGMRKLIKTQKDMLVTITVTGENFSASNPTQNIFTKDLIGGTDFVIKNDKLEILFLLDSIRGGEESFKEITKNSNLVPGDNLNITVSMVYAGEEDTITGSTLVGTTNSLFAAKDDGGNLSVAYVRHLNNLRYDKYRVNDNKAVTIAQTRSINYNYQNWETDAVIPAKAGSDPNIGTFVPLDNYFLFKNMIFHGNNKELLNFKITGGNYSGFFTKLVNCQMENMKLVNFSVTGDSYVGALAGQMEGGKITNCGVYLTTRDEYDRPLADMAERVERYRIKGNSYVGGMVGYTTNGAVTTSYSFTAINVIGSGNFVGGFFGDFNNGTITDSYTSGKITAGTAFGGGFAGNIVNTTISGCYSTSDVTYKGNNTYTGGFVGKATNGSISNSISYGLVQRGDGTLDKDYAGGFIGYAPSTSFNNCKFLSQPNYNYDYKKVNYGGISTGTFPDLKTKEINSPSNCHPYSDGLVGNSMPFAMLKTSDGEILPHYGDWPGEMKLQTSLVYYERYEKPDEEGNYFGYYAKTSLTVDGDDNNKENVNNWELNTLRQEPCIEDGYALMTIYSLEGFKYQLNGDLPNPEPKKEVKIANLDESKPEQATKITEKVSLLFTNTKSKSKYTISNAKVYRLPFALQMTDRNTAARFYDRLEITYERKDAEDKYTFFYCPDFANNAINPDISSTVVEATPKNPRADATEDSTAISVRSPRHLNALARAAYYWNTTKWTNDTDTKYYFRQENDINFGLYTKTYCGKAYDLMDTAVSNEYRNRPIGRPNIQAFKDPKGDPYTPSNFRNTYDGQGYKIIDYCCVTTKEDSYQFTGLFGEIQQATLKNIVMVASNPERESGYVISQYNDDTKVHHPGVGALVGLIYVGIPGADDDLQYGGTYSSVINCSVSGYLVKYEPINNAKTPSAVGGLAGYNFGRIENSSAVNKLVTASKTAGSTTRYVGGLAGSINGRGSILNSYAGGSVSVDGNASSTANLAGVCAGFENIYGAYYTDVNSRKMTIKNVYSYCEVTKGNSKDNVYAVANAEDKISYTNGYYLVDSEGKPTDIKDKNISIGKNFVELSGLSFSATDKAQASGRASAENTHPYRTDLKSIAYSYPAVVTDPREKVTTYVHYGDWYYETTLKDSGYLAYYELYSDGVVGIRYMNGKKDLATGGNYDTTNDKTIEQAGYGILRLSEDTGAFAVNGEVLQLNVVLKRDIPLRKGIYNLYSLKDTSLKLLMPESGEKSKAIQFKYEETEGTDRKSIERTIYINGAYADSISPTDLTASEEKPLKVRTAEQLQKLSAAGRGWYVKLDHDIIADTNLGEITNTGFVFDGGYLQGGAAKTYKNDKTKKNYKTGKNGNHIFGLTKPLFGTIMASGTVKNLALIRVDMNGSADSLAAVAKTNFGNLQNCFATGTSSNTSTTVGSAGLVLTNSGTITTSYANMDISNEKGDAASFVLRNNGTIENCYALGSVTSEKGKASGFIGAASTGANVKNCYTIANISGNQSYGFAPSDAVGVTASSCYWAKDKNLNKNVVNAQGTAKTLSQMKTVFTTDPWTTSNGGATWGDTVDGTYSYPRISALDHCGDWPLARGGKVGAVKLYRQGRSGGWGYNYYADGAMIDLGDSANTTIYQWTQSNVWDAYAIVFDSTFKEDLSNWEALVYYGSNNSPGKTVSPLSMTHGNMIQGQGTSLSAYVFTSSSSPKKIIIQNRNDNSEQYVFHYKNATFTYQP